VDSAVGAPNRADSAPDGAVTTIFAPAVRATTFGIAILMSMIAFEAMAVAPALPTAARELHGLAEYGWAFSIFLAANVVGMVVAGEACDTRGPRSPLIAGMVLFVAGLVIAGTSETMVQLIVSRGVQGLGGGLIATALYVLIGTDYPERLRPRVFTMTSAAWLLPSLIGPVVSGTVTQHVGWRWVFLGLLPFVLAGALLMTTVLRHWNAPAGVAAKARMLAQPRRLLFALLVAVGVAGFESAGQHRSAVVYALAVVGLAVVAGAMRGLVPPGTYRAAPGVAAPIALRGLLAGSFFGAESTLPLLLSQQHGYNATVAGLPLALSGFSWALGSWWQGRDVPDEGPARRVRLIRAGLLFIAAGIAAAAIVAVPAVPGWLIFLGWPLAGLGAGLSMSSVGVLVLSGTTDADRGRDTAALQLADTTFSAVTTGLAGILVAEAASAAMSYTGAFAAGDIAFFAVAVLGAAIAGRAGLPAAPA
jgi:MFS family permease